MEQLLTASQVAILCACSKPTLYRWMHVAGFPRPVKIGPRAARWRRHEVEQWVEDRPRGGQ